MAQVGADRSAVYLDPPYSKLQYSRYYHLLNVLVDYDYPPVERIGRYPPKDRRFSSRFEYQPGVAEREFERYFRACAEAKLDLFMSYGERGFVPIPRLITLMRQYFRSVHVFSELLRHHSQGVPLPSTGRRVREFVLVGTNACR